MDLFADLEGDFEVDAQGDLVDHNPLPQTYRERCPKCNGSGKYGPYRYLGQCFLCKGAGFREFKQPSEVRAKARERNAQRKDDARQAWADAHPDVVQWLRAKCGSFNFATELSASLDKYGSLTERQVEAVRRCIVKDAERSERIAAERAAREASAPVIEVGKIEEAFASAKANGIGRPVLRLAGFKFKPAPAHGKNAGAIYVTRGEDYLGKVSGGKFQRVYACDAVTEAEVLQVASDPATAAKAYGFRTGSCSCCGRALTNSESIELGIGPICASKYGW